MTTETLLQIVANRKLTMAYGLDGRPVLRGPSEYLTPNLLRVVRLHREKIVQKLGPAPPVVEPSAFWKRAEEFFAWAREWNREVDRRHGGSDDAPRVH